EAERKDKCNTPYTKQELYAHHTTHTEETASKPHTLSITETQSNTSPITPTI
ncbi:hypothetical protein K469DRAFT_718783, partial [Zopfia rhizophila CBS 207.26]